MQHQLLLRSVKSLELVVLLHALSVCFFRPRRRRPASDPRRQVGPRVRTFINFTNKKGHRMVSFLLSMGYKKDIFGRFVYDFEFLQKMKSLLTQG